LDSVKDCLICKLDKGQKIKQILEVRLEVEGLSLVERKCSKLNNELTKNTRVVRQRQFRMIDLEK